MRSFLGLTLLITQCASASAATVHHSRHHVFVRHSQGWAFAAPRPAAERSPTATPQQAGNGPGVRCDIQTAACER
jgi:hypothetical protein